MNIDDNDERPSTSNHLAYIVGTSCATAWLESDDYSVTSVLQWRTRHLAMFEDGARNQADASSSLRAWQRGFDEEVARNREIYEQPCDITETLSASYDDPESDGTFQVNALAMEACTGIHKCLELVSSSGDICDDDEDRERSRISVNDAASLLRFATASASMLAATLESAYGERNQEVC